MKNLLTVRKPGAKKMPSGTGNAMIAKICAKTAAILVLLLLLSACSRDQSGPQPQQQGTNQQNQQEKIPQLLKDIENDIEKIFEELKGPAVILEERDEEHEETENTTGGQNQSQGQNGEQQQQGQQQGGGQNQTGESGPNQAQGGQKQQQPADPWQKVSTLVNGLHFKWNGFMPEAGKKGANKALIDNFGNSLNKFTNIISKKNTAESLLALSELYSNIPDFYSLYKSGVSPEIKRIRHYTREIILYSKTGEWSRVETTITNLRSSWSLFKNTLDKEHETTSGKLDYSIYELEKVVAEKNQNLTEIKGNVMLANIRVLEKDLQKKSEIGQIQ